MATGEIASRLHLVIDRCVRRYAEGESKEVERDVLVSLSQVQSLIPEIASNLPPAPESLCLETLVADLVGLLGMKSAHVQHLAGNILAHLSHSLLHSGTQWDAFIRLLCHSLTLPVFYILPTPDLHYLQTPNCCTASAIFRLLRNILKRLTQEENDQLLHLYLESVNSSLAKIPWCQVDTLLSLGHYGSTANTDQLTVFLGNFLQFLSSLVQHVRFVENPDDSRPMHLILQKTIDLVPHLLLWCQPKLQSQTASCMSRYLAHKSLVLMVRLTDHSNIKCTILLSWLQYLQHHFEGFLQHSLPRIQPFQDNCLEGSPFVVNMSDRDINETPSNHLQRLSVFLFLRCSFTLLYSSRHTDKDCEFKCRKKGIKEMFKWFEPQISADTFSDHKIYTKKTVDISTSFIRLFMHEDDLLFKVLVQFLSVPLHGEELLNVVGRSLQDEEQTIHFRLSAVFNPVILFCVFLSELHYDHQVLLDYLISKDTGASCAEYLLRCLRTACDSWTLFVDFPFEGNLDASPKRRKYSVEQNWNLRSQAFEGAKDCLLSLQNSVTKLHQKKLFPYNPEALLRRLSRFQELCLLHE